jgi:hypothetical protein
VNVATQKSNNDIYFMGNVFDILDISSRYKRIKTSFWLHKIKRKEELK